MLDKAREELKRYRPYDRLRLSVVLLAMEDYKSALANDNQGEIKSLERFFLSDWGQFLSNDHGDYIIACGRKSVKPKRHKPKKTVKITPIEKV